MSRSETAFREADGVSLSDAPSLRESDRHDSDEAFDRWLHALPYHEFSALLEFANSVQRWSWRGWKRRGHYGTFGQAAAYLKVPVERVADAVGAHYWLFTLDHHLPLADRRIDHEGE